MASFPRRLLPFLVLSLFFLLNWSPPLLGLPRSAYPLETVTRLFEGAHGARTQAAGLGPRVPASVSSGLPSAGFLLSSRARSNAKTADSPPHWQPHGVRVQRVTRRTGEAGKRGTGMLKEEESIRGKVGRNCQEEAKDRKHNRFPHYDLLMTSCVPNAFLGASVLVGLESSVLPKTHHRSPSSRSLFFVSRSSSPFVRNGVDDPSETFPAFLPPLPRSSFCIHSPSRSFLSSFLGALPATWRAEDGLPRSPLCTAGSHAEPRLRPPGPSSPSEFLVSHPALVPRLVWSKPGAVSGMGDDHARLLEKFQQEFARLQSILPASLPPESPSVSGPSPANAGGEKNHATKAGNAAGERKDGGTRRDGKLPTVQDLLAEVQREGHVPKRDPKVLKELEEVIDGLYKDSEASNDSLFSRLTNLVKSGAFGERLQEVYEEQERDQSEAEEAQRKVEATDGFNPHDVAKAVREATANPSALKVARAIMAAGNMPEVAQGDAPGAVGERRHADDDASRAEREKDAEEQRLRRASEHFAEAPEKAAGDIKNEGDLFDIIRGSTKQYLEQLNMKPTPPGQTRVDDNTVIHWKEETDILQVWIPLPRNYIRESIDVSMARARLRVSCRVAGASTEGKQTEDTITIVDRQMKGYIVSADAHWTIASYPFKRPTGQEDAQRRQHFVHAVGPKRADSRSIWGGLFGEPPSREEWMLQNDERYTQLDGTKPPPPHVLKAVPELDQPEVKNFIEAFNKMREEAAKEAQAGGEKREEGKNENGTETELQRGNTVERSSNA
ncbi:conserved hypothetical protein [Neospora caninum Liverpool]|uniref:CS domain-containing protein n=1 Tax=Neospora caninum (strain Liverpool) TaxID=572307 RepID=F0V8S5_NEOCL|nr:conserved hypothetical protein [Neospora caninum Liverpool]CBZ50116.1 conserved hypothetical protein [Neospora caninum Liverpool]CEL64710.1 TPA: hypothetical protein BN1204_005920 [Neospora caninum Liverpool]|eukprot:XP_003880151.1 conserved hypothetical protein [Neospora caninum Liverpool]